MVWHGMFRVVPFAFSVEKSTPDGKKYASGAGALVTNHSYAPPQAVSIKASAGCDDYLLKPEENRPCTTERDSDL